MCAGLGAQRDRRERLAGRFALGPSRDQRPGKAARDHPSGPGAPPPDRLEMRVDLRAHLLRSGGVPNDRDAWRIGFSLLDSEVRHERV